MDSKYGGDDETCRKIPSEPRAEVEAKESYSNDFCCSNLIIEVPEIPTSKPSSLLLTEKL